MDDVEAVARRMRVDDLITAPDNPEKDWADLEQIDREMYVDEARSAITAYKAWLADNGWAIVTREPTEEMQVEGLTKLCDVIEGELKAPMVPQPDEEWLRAFRNGAITRNSRETNAVWAAMLMEGEMPKRNHRKGTAMTCRVEVTGNTGSDLVAYEGEGSLEHPVPRGEYALTKSYGRNTLTGDDGKKYLIVAPEPIGADGYLDQKIADGILKIIAGDRPWED